jgi:hypothetical protein
LRKFGDERRSGLLYESLEIETPIGAVLLLDPVTNLRNVKPT